MAPLLAVTFQRQRSNSEIVSERHAAMLAVNLIIAQYADDKGEGIMKGEKR